MTWWLAVLIAVVGIILLEKEFRVAVWKRLRRLFSPAEEDPDERIRKMIRNEIALQVPRAARTNEIMNTDLASLKVEAHQHAKERLIAAVRSFAADSGISEEWLLKNGGFQPVPYENVRLGGFPSSSYMQLFTEGRIRDKEDYDLISCVTHDLHVFGSELGSDSLEDTPNESLELILQYRDRLLRVFNAASD